MAQHVIVGKGAVGSTLAQELVGAGARGARRQPLGRHRRRPASATSRSTRRTRLR